MSWKTTTRCCTWISSIPLQASNVLHKTQNIYTDMYIQIYTITLCIWICTGVNVNSSNMKVVITLASKVRHLVNTVRPLWLSVSTKHQWCKQSLSPSEVLVAVDTSVSLARSQRHLRAKQTTHLSLTSRVHWKLNTTEMPQFGSYWDTANCVD